PSSQHNQASRPNPRPTPRRNHRARHARRTARTGRSLRQTCPHLKHYDDRRKFREAGRELISGSVEIGRFILVWCLRNSYTFVALKLAWGEARGRECIPSDTRPTEQRSPSPRPISAQPEGRHVFWAEALLLAPYRSTSGYARRSRLASAQNPLPRMYSYFGDTTPKDKAEGGSNPQNGSFKNFCISLACPAITGQGEASVSAMVRKKVNFC